MSVPFDTVLTILKQHEANGDFPGYEVRVDYLRSLYFYCTLLPEDATVVELGTLYGCSLVTMAAALKGEWSMIGIDPALEGTFNYPDCHKVEGHTLTSSYKRIFELADECGLKFSDLDIERPGLITLYGHRSWEILKTAKTFNWNPVDCVFIDGEHTYEAVTKDLQWANLIKPGGLLILDDYMDFTERALKKYMQENSGWAILHESTKPPVDDWVVTIAQKD